MSGSLLAASSYSSSETIKYKYTERKIIASDAASDDYFGSSVSISGNLIVVGSTNDDHSGYGDAGSAYVYRYNGTSWVQEQKLTASDAAESDYFGTSVSVSGNLIVVGSMVNDHGGFTEAGSAYVYRYNGTSWVQEQKLTASDAASNEIFGWSVSISDNVIVVGSKIDDHSGFTEAGSAYVYRYNGTSWVQEQKLTASDAAAGENFGSSVSVSGNVIVVGSAYDDHSGFTEAGSAYVYRYNGTSWVQEQKLTASDPAINDYFGWSVSVSGDLIVVGSTNDDHSEIIDAGSAYVYRYNGTSWVQEKKLTASDAASTDNFGFSVSVGGDIIVVGAYLDDHSGITDAGSAYVYTIELNIDWSTWTSGMVSSTNLNMPTTAVLESNGYIPNSWNFWDGNAIGSTNRSMPTTATIESDGYISNSWYYWSVDQVSSTNINMSSTAIEMSSTTDSGGSGGSGGLGGSGYNSVYFDGTTGYITFPTNGAFEFGTGNFTIEFWQNYSSLTNFQTIISSGYVGGLTAGGWAVQTGNGDGKINFHYIGSSSTTVIASETGTTPVVGQWYHIAIVKNGTTVTIYRNGVSVDSETDSNTYSANAQVILGGGANTGLNNYWVNGYISNLRIVKGTAVYTSNFTPSTTPLTVITGTSLLLAVKNELLMDNSDTTITIIHGNAAISTLNPFV